MREECARLRKKCEDAEKRADELALHASEVPATLAAGEAQPGEKTSRVLRLEKEVSPLQEAPAVRAGSRAAEAAHIKVQELEAHVEQLQQRLADADLLYRRARVALAGGLCVCTVAC